MRKQICIIDLLHSNAYYLFDSMKGLKNGNEQGLKFMPINNDYEC